MNSSSGPNAMTINASTARPAKVPSAAGRQLRTVATASTIVNASTTSTSELRKAAEIAGAAVVQIGIELSMRGPSGDLMPGKIAARRDVASSKQLKIFVIRLKSARRISQARLGRSNSSEAAFGIRTNIGATAPRWILRRVSQHGDEK